MRKASYHQPRGCDIVLRQMIVCSTRWQLLDELGIQLYWSCNIVDFHWWWIAYSCCGCILEDELSMADAKLHSLSLGASSLFFWRCESATGDRVLLEYQCRSPKTFGNDLQAMLLECLKGPWKTQLPHHLRPAMSRQEPFWILLILLL